MQKQASRGDTAAGATQGGPASSDAAEASSERAVPADMLDADSPSGSSSGSNNRLAGLIVGLIAAAVTVCAAVVAAIIFLRR